MPRNYLQSYSNEHNSGAVISVNNEVILSLKQERYCNNVYEHSEQQKKSETEIKDVKGSEIKVKPGKVL